MKHNSKIAISIQNEVQFFSIRPILPALLGKNEVDLVVDDFLKDIDDGLADLTQKLLELLKSEHIKFSLASEHQKEKYDIWITPYIETYLKPIIDANIILKYEYGTLNIKPNLTYTIERMGQFDGFLCNSTITAELLNAYGKTFLVDNLRFVGLKREVKNRKGRKKLLFAPTYNDNQKEWAEMLKMLQMLKKDYLIMIKAHHSTHYHSSKKTAKYDLMSLADEYYDSSTPLSSLLCKADICLTGHSSTIGEALYIGTPCAIYAENINEFMLEDLHTTQYRLVKAKILPYCEAISKIPNVLKLTLDKQTRTKQKEAALKIFPPEMRTGTKGWLSVIECCLKDDLTQDYLALQRYKNKNIADGQDFQERLYKTVNDLQKELKIKDTEMGKMSKIIAGYNEGKLYKAAHSIYELKRKVVGK